MKTITLIAAMTADRVIGISGKMPWHLPSELQHFKQATMHKSIVMGRKTWESIGRPLPGRQNIVVSGSAGLRIEGCEVAHSLEDALARSNSDEVMIIGGGDLYRQALPIANRMILTFVEGEVEGDTFFPAWDPEDWGLVTKRTVARSATNPMAFEVRELHRVSTPAGGQPQR